MTKTEKCDCCRQRKVKCDEKHPTCGPCAKAGRECKYTYGQVSGFVSYQHQESHATSSGGASSSSAAAAAHHSSSSRSTTHTHPEGKSASASSSSKGKKSTSKDGEVVLSLRSSKSTHSGSSSGLLQTFNLVPARKKQSSTSSNSKSNSNSSSNKNSSSKKASRKPHSSGGGDSSSSSSKKKTADVPDESSAGPTVWEGSATDESTAADIAAAAAETAWMEPDEPSSLLCDWLSLLGGAGGSYGGHESALYCLGDWVDTVQAHVGQSTVVDAAVTAVLGGVAAFRDRSEESIALARESNMNALRNLRLSLAEDRQTADSRGALVATKLLDLAELLINPETYHRQHHVRGLIDILRRLNSQNQAYDETIQSIYYSHFFAEVRVSRPLGEQDDDIDDVDALNMRAMYRGETSAFERTSWYDMEAPTLETAESRWPGYTLALQTTMQDFIRLARLVVMTRQVTRHHHHQRDSSSTHGLRAGAVHLARTLYEETPVSAWLADLLDLGAVRVVPTVQPEAQALTRHSYRFASPRLYQLLALHWTSRLVLGGCLLRLAAGANGGSNSSSEASSLSLDLFDIQEADLRSAESVAMCVDYGLQLDPSLPCAQMVLLAPLKTALGAWHRQGRRGAAGGEMVAWCVVLVNQMERSLCLRVSTQEELVRRAECLAGWAVYEQ